MSLEGITSALKQIKGKIHSFNVYHTDAYAIAIRNGFEGTEAEWLESLKGEPGKQGVQGKGTTITMSRFTKADGVVSGKSGIELAAETKDPATGAFSLATEYLYDGDGIDNVTVEMLEAGSEPTASLSTVMNQRNLKLGIPYAVNTSANTAEVSIFEEKTAAFYGDSLTEANSHYTKGYHKWLQELLGLASYNNYGKSGYKVSDVYSKVNSVADTADIVFVMCGVNDQTFSVPLGAMGDNTSGTTYGALNLLCALLKQKYPTSIIVFITPHYQTKFPHSGGITSYEVSKAVKEVCEKYAIPVYDNFVLSGIYSTNLSTFTTDNCHWNDVAHEMVGKNLAKFMLDTFRYIHGASAGEDTHTHSYTETVTTAATCTTAGVKTFTCECGESYTESIQATGHNYVEGVCSICGAADPDYDPEVTLASISATYSGGSVTAGTALTDLTGIVVTATYSDGSTATVTDYTLSGEIAEGENTITATYEGVTTTFVVAGVAESGAETSGLFDGKTLTTSGTFNASNPKLFHLILHCDGNYTDYTATVKATIDGASFKTGEQQCYTAKNNDCTNDGLISSHQNGCTLSAVEGGVQLSATYGAISTYPRKLVFPLTLAVDNGSATIYVDSITITSNGENVELYNISGFAATEILTVSE